MSEEEIKQYVLAEFEQFLLKMMKLKVDGKTIHVPALEIIQEFCNQPVYTPGEDSESI